MGEYTSRLAKRIKGKETAGERLLTAEYVSPAAIRIGGELFSHNIHRNPECTAAAGDTVLVAQIGSGFYIICKVV